MRKPRTGIGLFLCLLLASILGGCCTTGVSKVVVGPTPDVLSKPEVTISIRNHDVVYWRSSDGSDLSVVFKATAFPKAADGQPPFIMGAPNQDQSMSCKDGVCFSYDINPALAGVFQHHPEIRELRYAYDQKLSAKGADGMIIIKP